MDFNIKELRAGNWVSLYNDECSCWRNATVEETAGDRVIFTNMDIAPIEKIRPIEISKNNVSKIVGVRKDKKAFYSNLDKWDICVHDSVWINITYKQERLYVWLNNHGTKDSIYLAPLGDEKKVYLHWLQNIYHLLSNGGELNVDFDYIW